MGYYRAFFLLCGLLAAAAGGLGSVPARSQPLTGAASGDPAVAVPGFWDPKRRPERPDVTRIPAQIRFATTDDFPPFSFRDANGQPTGFNVDLARAICTELAIVCTLEVRDFETLVEALDSDRADAAIAAIAISAAAREKVDLSARYFRSPARFVGRKTEAGEAPAVTPEAAAGKTIGVIAGTAHEAYLKDFFAGATIRALPDAEAVREALKRGEIDLIFGDGVQLAFWLNGTSSAGCCRFIGGPFTESGYFGYGMGIAVKHGNDALRLALNYALARLWEKGVYTDLYLRWYPISVY